jgi:hypothetical protein
VEFWNLDAAQQPESNRDQVFGNRNCGIGHVKEPNQPDASLVASERSRHSPDRAEERRDRE